MKRHKLYVQKQNNSSLQLIYVYFLGMLFLQLKINAENSRDSYTCISKLILDPQRLM